MLINTMYYQSPSYLSTKLFKVGVLAVLLFLSATAQSAEVNWYKIELIVFEQQSASSEKFQSTSDQVDWPENVVKLNRGNRKLSSMSSELVPYTTISAEDSKLAFLYHKLGQSADYTGVLRRAWIQPVSSNRSGEAVQILGNGVNGYARLERGTYLHLVIDLSYSGANPAEGDASFGDSAEGFEEEGVKSLLHIRERRRILLKETHYFDHPRLGVITRVSLL